MIDEHELLMADVAALALGALDEEERARVEAHLAGCDECRQLLAEYRGVADLLPFGERLERPSRATWEAIAVRIRGEAPATLAALPRSSPAVRQRRWAPDRFLLAAAAVV